MSQTRPTTQSAPSVPSSSASPHGPGSQPPSKLRSCVVCRSRKVRCDKQSPCSNCRRANIACVVPSNDRPPRWARRLERLAPSVAATGTASAKAQNADVATGPVMERLRNLEGLVKELSSQLEQANASSGNTNRDQTDAHSPSKAQDSDSGKLGLQESLGRLVLQEENQTTYISSGFWSRVSDELDGLKIDTRALAHEDSDTSDDEDGLPSSTPGTSELDRAPSDRHAFLFGHNLGGKTVDLQQYRPLPSQIPFLLDIYAENVNFFMQVVHMPTVMKLTRVTRGTPASSLSPANEALLFSIYYAAVTSMEDDDVITNFGSSKRELNLKYRLGLEHALSKADFLNFPDITLVQALTIFLFLARRHDSPKFVWMMTGLVIRMAQSIGLQRDGGNSPHLSPYEIEMRRRVWWSVCMLDTRASEDQGTDYSIMAGFYDTKMPLNINDAEISPETKEMPDEHEALTDMSMALVTHEMCGAARQMTAPGAREAGMSLEEQNQQVDAFFENLHRMYLQYIDETGNIAYWVTVTATRLIMCKQRLFIYLPALFAAKGKFTQEIRNKLLVSAIELAEYNHALNAEWEARHWRWSFQTYTHWHCIAYLLIECARRPWSPIAERAWMALHSPWLIPAQPPNVKKHLRIWVPLRKMMMTAKRHRDSEIQRLRENPSAVEELKLSDQRIPAPESRVFFSDGNGQEKLLEHWYGLFRASTKGSPEDQRSSSRSSTLGESVPTPPQHTGTACGGYQGEMWPNSVYGAGYGSMTAPGNADQLLPATSQRGLPDKTQDLGGWSDRQVIDPGFTEWLWSDSNPMMDMFSTQEMDMNMEVDANFDWNVWAASATGMQLDD